MDVDGEMARLQRQIEKVENDIEKAENTIQGRDLTPEDKQYWREKERLLRLKEQTLWEEKNKLLDLKLKTAMALVFREGESPPKSESEMADGTVYFPPEELGDGAALCKFLQKVQPTQQVSCLLLGVKRRGLFGWTPFDENTSTISHVDDNILVFRKLMPVATSDDDPRTKRPRVGGSFVPLNLKEEYTLKLEEYIEGRICLPRYTKNSVDLPCYCKRPSLLLHRLVEHDTKRFDDFIRSSTRFVLMFGTSGAGKTRTLYSHLSKNFGLYFVCSDLGNGGSADLRNLINKIKNFMGDDPSKNANVVIFAVTLLLLARLQIFFYCKCKNVTPEGWLLLQAACQHLDKDGNPVNLDIFSAHFADLFEQNNGVFSLPQAELMTEIGRARKEIMDLAAGDVLPLIVVDEAQIICAHNPVHGTFQSDMPNVTGIHEKRPLAKPVLEALYEPKSLSQHHVVFAGTGFTLYFRRHEFCSAIAKSISEDDQYKGFLGWKSPVDMVAYARGILNVDQRVESIIKHQIFPWFRGRFRPFATLLEEVTLRGVDIKRLWKVVKEGLTTEKKLPGIKSFYHQVKDFGTEGKDTIMSKEQVIDVINVLLEATIQYFYYGRPYIIAHTDLAAIILEMGVGRIETEDSLVTIDEPLPLLAMYNYFLDSGQIQYARMNGINYSSSEGLYWQHLLPIEFEKKWKEKGGVMDFMELFNEELSKDLEDLKPQRSTILEGHHWDGKPPHEILLATEGYQSCDYLKDEKPRCKFLVCEDRAGCDIMWRVRFEYGITILFSVQLKLRTSIGEATAAMKKAAPVGGLIKLWKSSIICLLVAYPASRGGLPAVKRQKLANGRSKCTLVVDRANAHMLLNESHLKNLDLLKRNREILLDNCQDCGKRNDDSDGSKVNWIACDVCNRWYHSSCVNAKLDEDFICIECNEDEEPFT